MKNQSRTPQVRDHRAVYEQAPMPFVHLWPFPPEYLSLRSDEVHVWLAFLDPMTPRLSSLLHILAADEIEKAGRFRFQKDRNEYILARGLLRSILSRYTGTSPGQLRFNYNHYGKPALATECGSEQLAFNASHAHGTALYAVTSGRKVGVDLESVRADLDHQQIAERFFSPREVSMLGLLPSDLRQEAFFACWTRKEAYIKAKGEGLSLDLESFDVVLAPDQPAAALRIESDPSEARRWWLTELDAPPGYVAALVVEGKACKVKYWQWAN